MRSIWTSVKSTEKHVPTASFYSVKYTAHNSRHSPSLLRGVVVMLTSAIRPKCFVIKIIKKKKKIETAVLGGAALMFSDNVLYPLININ